MKAMLALAARLTLAAGLVLSAAPAALAQDEVIPFAPDDAAMEAALAEARGRCRCSWPMRWTTTAMASRARW